MWWVELPTATKVKGRPILRWKLLSWVTEQLRICMLHICGVLHWYVSWLSKCSDCTFCQVMFHLLMVMGCEPSPWAVVSAGPRVVSAGLTGSSSWNLHRPNGDHFPRYESWPHWLYITQAHLSYYFPTQIAALCGLSSWPELQTSVQLVLMTATWDGFSSSLPFSSDGEAAWAPSASGPGCIAVSW